MINNLDTIKPLLNYSEPGDFYMLYVLKRKKDQPEGERDNHQSVRTIKTYCIESIDHLERRYDEIKQLCEMFKARAYIHVQKQNHKDVSLNMMIELAEKIRNGQHNQKNLFDSTVGKMKTQEKRWIVDIDTKDGVELMSVSLWIDTQCRPLGSDSKSKIVALVPTANGFHLITHRFDMVEFKKQYPNIDVQKKNPTLLYLPKSLSQKSPHWLDGNN